MLRWLVPENGQPSEKWLPDEQLRQQIRVIVETGNTMDRLQNSDQQISLHQRITFGAQMRYLVFGGRDVQRTGHLLRNTRRQSRYKQWELGFRQIKRGEHLLAVLGFAAGSWRLGSRNRYVGWTDEQREANLKLVVNNARFLIMPWIHSANRDIAFSALTNVMPLPKGYMSIPFVRIFVVTSAVCNSPL